MQRFRRMKSLQKFASLHASFHNPFNSEHHLVDRETFKVRRSAALTEWQTLAACDVLLDAPEARTDAIDYRPNLLSSLPKIGEVR